MTIIRAASDLPHHRYSNQRNAAAHGHSQPDSGVENFMRTLYRFLSPLLFRPRIEVQESRSENSLQNADRRNNLRALSTPLRSENPGFCGEIQEIQVNYVF